MINIYPAKVKAVITSPNEPLAKKIAGSTGYPAIGTIKYKVDENLYKSINGNKSFAKPANPRIMDLPLLDEYVLIFNTISHNSNYNEYYESTYYLPMQLNFWGNKNHNSNPDTPADMTDKGTITEAYMEAIIGNPQNPSNDPLDQLNIYQGDHFREKKIKALLPKEGDYLMEGRFGQSIRFGSTTDFNLTAEGDRDSWSEGSELGDPITIISNGLPNNPDIYKNNSIKDDDIEKPWISTVEDINNDPSSIWLTSNHKINNFTPAGVGHASIHAFKPEEKTDLDNLEGGTNYITKTDLSNDPLPESNEEDIVTTIPKEIDIEQIKTDNSELALVEGEEMTPFYIIEGSTDENNIQFVDTVENILTNNPSTIQPENLEGIQVGLSHSIGSYFKLAHLISTPKAQDSDYIYTSSYDDSNHPEADWVRTDTEIGFYINTDNIGRKRVITKEYLGGEFNISSSYRILHDEPVILPTNSVEPYQYVKNNVELLREAESYIFGNYSNYGVNNYPGIDSFLKQETILTNLTNLFTNCIDPIIEGFSGNIKIVSAYRSKALNRTLSKNPSHSEHIYGYAVDIRTSDIGNNSGLFDWIYLNLEFKNLMWAYPEREENSWIHISYIEGENHKKTTLLSENDSFHNQYNGTRRGPNNFYQDNITQALTPLNFQN